MPGKTSNWRKLKLITGTKIASISSELIGNNITSMSTIKPRVKISI